LSRITWGVNGHGEKTYLCSYCYLVFGKVNPDTIHHVCDTSKPRYENRNKTFNPLVSGASSGTITLLNRNTHRKREIKMKKQPITITAPMSNGEVAVFRVIPAGTMEQLADDLEWVVAPECIQDLEDMGCLTIV